jgi:hypothetical protein
MKQQDNDKKRGHDPHSYNDITKWAGFRACCQMSSWKKPIPRLSQAGMVLVPTAVGQHALQPATTYATLFYNL